ncbi:MAG TPA: hypothetical protein VGD67_26800 [Pseudonocardiaceae bacterium]
MTGPLYLPVEPDAWALVRHYHGESALLSVLGPFPSAEAARDAAQQLGDLAGHDAWTPVPLRTVAHTVQPEPIEPTETTRRSP